MCGIFGVLDRRRLADDIAWTAAEISAFERARDAMAHRGPDGAGTWSAAGVLLGHRRLSILDLSATAAQPMRHDNGSVLTFNGEIYNYIELRQDLRCAGVQVTSSGDTEVLLAALACWGVEETLQRVRGMFAFAWWDAARQELWLSRDPVGKKPLYVADDGVQLVFSSTLEALLLWRQTQGSAPAAALEVDAVAVEHYLACGYIPAPRTILKNVAKLGAQQWQRAGLRPNVSGRYHPVPFATEGGDPLVPMTLDTLQHHFDRAIERRLRSDVPVATFLSGGLDSSLVTAAAARHHGAQLVAYTVMTGDNNADELEIAKGVARHVGADHRLLTLDLRALDRFDELVRHWGEPFGDSSALPSFLIAEAAGREHRVILTGDGGDEVQGGYRPAQLFAARRLLHDVLHVPTVSAPQTPPDVRPATRRSSRLDALRFRLGRLLRPGADALTMQADDLNALSHIFTPEAQATVRGEGWLTYMQRRFDALPSHDELDRILAMDFTLYLPEDLNVKVDVATMAHSVEARAPLLDVDFTDASWRIRAADRVRPWQRKRIIHALAGRFLPDHLLIRRKHGFSIPIDRFMATPALREEIEAAARRGHPLLDPVLDGERLAAELRRRWSVGQAAGTFAWRVRWLQRWAEWAATLGPS